LAVGAEDAAADDGDALRAVQQLRSAPLEDVSVAVDERSDDRRDHAVEEDRRQRDPATANEREVMRLEGAGALDGIPEREERRVVLARIAIGDRGQLAGVD